MYTMQTLIRGKLEWLCDCQDGLQSKEGHRIERGYMYQEDVMLNVRIPNRAATDTKQKLVKLEGEIGKSTSTVGDVTVISLELIEPLENQQTELNNTISQPDCSHPTRAEYTFFSSAHRTYIKRDHILSHETNKSQHI